MKTARMQIEKDRDGRILNWYWEYSDYGYYSYNDSQGRSTNDPAESHYPEELHTTPITHTREYIFNFDYDDGETTLSKIIVTYSSLSYTESTSKVVELNQESVDNMPEIMGVIGDAQVYLSLAIEEMEVGSPEYNLFSVGLVEISNFEYGLIQLEQELGAESPVTEDDGTWGQWEYLRDEIQNAQAATVKITHSTATMINDKFAITAAHSPLDENNEIEAGLTVTNIFGEERAIVNVFYDAGNADFAIVELESAFTNSYSVKVASSEASIGEDLFAVGHPGDITGAGMGWAVTFGDTDNFAHDAGESTEFNMNFTPGYSGGGIYNSSGELISVVSGTSDGYVDGNTYFKEDFEVHNNLLDNSNSEGSRIGVGTDLDFINSFLAEHNITSELDAGGDALPFNPVDPVREDFVDASAISAIELQAQDSRHSTVAISRSNTDNYDGFFVSGTGVIISDDFILTNAHVVDGKDEVSIMFTDGSIIADNDIYVTSWDNGWTDNYDFALISLNGAIPDSSIIAEFADNELQMGEDAYFVGHPGIEWFNEGGWQVMAGEVNSVLDEGAIRLDSNPVGGFSGSGLFDLDGKLAGLINGGGSSMDDGFNIQDPHSTAYSSAAGDGDANAMDYDNLVSFIGIHTDILV